MKKLVCVIDTLNSGGAQRQMVNLINYLLVKQVHVHLFVVYPIFNIENLLIRSEFLTFEKNVSKNYYTTFSALYKLAKTKNNYIFLSYLNGPNYLLILLKLLKPKTFICISERRGYDAKVSLFKCLKYFPYVIANVVIFNSYDTFNKIVKYCFPLKLNSRIIYNLTNLGYTKNKLMTKNRFSFIANYRPEKNHLLLFDTIKKYKDNLSGISISCYGNNFYVNNKPTKNSIFYDQLKIRLYNDKIQTLINLNEHTDNISNIHFNSEYLILLSKHEGFPNVVCEAMMYGSIIISTKVSDIDKFIIHKINGYILKDSTPEEVFNAFDWALSLSINDKVIASNFNIKLAMNYFYFETNGKKYIDILDL